jgi:hypothetical protein
MVSVVSGIIEKHGGLQGVVSEFERNGLGPLRTINRDQAGHCGSRELDLGPEPDADERGSLRRSTLACPLRDARLSVLESGEPLFSPPLGADEALRGTSRPARKRVYCEPDG